MADVCEPLYVLDFGNPQIRDLLRSAVVHPGVAVSLRNGFGMRRPAIDGTALLRPDGDLAISIGLGSDEPVSTWAYMDVLEAMDYLEAS